MTVGNLGAAVGRPGARDVSEGTLEITMRALLKALFIAAHTMDVEGMPKDEGRALIKQLIEHATQPQYTFSVSWNVGDMVIWDNLCSMHRGGDFDYGRYKRDMRRTTVREGTEPHQLETGDDPFSELFSRSPKIVSSRSAKQRAPMTISSIRTGWPESRNRLRIR